MVYKPPACRKQDERKSRAGHIAQAWAVDGEHAIVDGDSTSSADRRLRDGIQRVSESCRCADCSFVLDSGDANYFERGVL